jgi:chromosome segregation ATPase
MWPTVVVVGVMFLYGYAVYKKTRAGAATPEDSDTFYYLGFIYTLVTLVAALLPFLMAEDLSAELNQKRVLGVFGIGLVTTFIGLGGRILFAQLQRGHANSVEGGAQDAAIALSGFGRRVDSAALEFGTALEAARGELTAAISDAARQISESGRTMAVAVEQSITTTIRQSGDQIRDSANQFADSLNIATKSIHSGKDGVEEALAGLKQVIVDQRKAIERQLPTLATLGEKLSNQAEDWAQVTARIASEHERFEKTLTAATSALATHLAKTSESIGALDNQTQRAAINLDGLAQSAASTTKAVGEVLPKVQGAVSNADASIQAIIQALKGVEAGARTAQAVAGDTHRELQEINAGLRSDVSTSAEALRDVHDNLVKMTRKLVAELKP